MIPPHLIEQTSRSRKLAKLRAYYKGCQYKGMPDFWTGINPATGEVVPVRERAPCVVYNLPKAAVRECIKFAVGEGRFPRVKVEADKEIAGGVALSDAEAKDLSAFMSALVEHSKLMPHTSRAMRSGLSTGTAVVVVSLFRGRFIIKHIQAEYCQPVYDDNGDLESVTWCYRFCKEVVENGALEKRYYYFRRDYTREEELVYHDAEYVAGEAPVWRVKDRVPHGLGFVPARWTRNSGEDDQDDIDGESIYGEQLLPECDALNLALSQRTRTINFWGAPQPWETGVEDGAPQPTGRTSREPDPFDVKAHIPGHRPAISPTKPARKNAVDQIWSYPSVDAKVGLLETTGKAAEVTTNHINDISARIKEAMQVVLADPSKIAGKGEVSAKLMAMLYAPLLGHVDQLRECWWDEFIKPVLCIMLRIVAKFGKSVLVPGAPKVAPMLAKFHVSIDGAETWVDPPMKPVWGVYFAPSGTETETAVRTADAATKAGLISRRTAAEYVAEDFGVRDVDAELEEAEVAEEEPDPAAPEKDPTSSNQ